MELNLCTQTNKYGDIKAVICNIAESLFQPFKRKVFSVKYSTASISLWHNDLWHKDILVLSKCTQEIQICRLETKKGSGEVQLYSVTRINTQPKLQTIEKAISKVLNLKYYCNPQFVQHSQVTTPREIPIQSTLKTSNGHSTIQKNVIGL